jgi:hypothetical protein
MSFQNLVNKNVNKAFNLIKDLATDVTFTKKAITGFDFNTKSNTAGTDTIVTTKAVIIESKKGRKGSIGSNTSRNAQRKEIMLKTQDIGDISFYDFVTFGGNDWKIGATIADNGFIVMSEIYREV